MRIVISAVILLSVLVLGISLSPQSYGIGNHTFELDWGQSGKTEPSNFLFPQRIAEGNDGSIYVTDLGNSRIQIFDSSGNFINTWGMNGSGAGEFNSPQGIAVSENFVFVSDNKLNKIQKFDLDGNFVSQWGEPGKYNGQFNSPSGLFISDEVLFVVDSGNNRVQKFTLEGEYISEFGKKGISDSKFLNPIDIAIDETGNIFVADIKLKKIVKFNSDNELIASFDGHVGGFTVTPSGIDIDKNGNLYVVDAANFRIVHLDQNGLTLTQWGQYGMGNGQFNLPKDVLVANDGYVFVVDTNSHRIQKFETSLVIPTIIEKPEVLVEPEVILPPPIYILNDFVKPVIFVPENVIVEATGGLTSVKIGYATAEDESGILSLLNNAPKKFPLGISTIIWTAIDGSGNMSIAPQTVTVQDTTPPEISQLPRIVGEARSLNQNIIGLSQPNTFDAVGIISIVSDAPETYSFGETIVTWTVTDVMGNVSTIEQIIQLNDTHNPTIIQPENIVFEAINISENPVILFEPTAIDNIAIDTLSNDAPEFFPLGETIVTWTATDISGNSVNTEQLINVVDTITPVIIINDIILEAVTSNGIITTIDYPEIYDIQEVDIMNDAPSKFPFGETIVTWNVTDESGNSSTQSQNITVVDTTSPSIILPDDIIVEAIDETTNIENIGDIISEDISGISSISNDAPKDYSLGETIVTWTVADNYGNIVNASQIITIVDTTNPRILVSGDIIIEASSMSENTIELDVPRVIDNVEIILIENNAPEFFPLGETIVTWTVTDTSGNVSTAQQQISFQDTLQPSLSIPDNLLIEINDSSGMIVDIGVASAIDIVEINPQISNDAPEFFPLGETIVTWTATDQSGNVIESEQIITVVDTTLPEFVIPLDISMEAQDKNTNYVEFDVPSVYDLVGVSSISNDAPEFFPLGETIVTWTATDTSGNQSSISQLFTLIDTTNPEIQISEKIILEATSKSENTITLENLIAIDTVEIASISNDAPEFFPLGETIVTWTATDTSGNSISEKQSISIIDTISPTIQTTEYLIIEADSQNNIVELGTISAIDTVEIASISNDAPEFFPLGETIVTWTATDTSGNSSSDMQVIKIVDTTAPTIVQSIDIEYEATSIDQNIVNLGIADAIDSVSEIIISNDAPEFFPLGETIVTWTATDESGNSSSDVQVIKIVDTTAPTIVQPIEIIADASSFTNTLIELSQPEVFDFVTDVKLKNNTNGSFAFGETIVTWTATDESGNSSSVTQKITIIDQSAPTLDIPTDIVIDANSPQTIIDIGISIISDTVDVNPQISNDAPEFFPLGETIVTWTATDESGNSFSSTQSINVQACGNSISYYNLILGTADDDILIGTNSSDLIFSFEGNDIISGNQGNDCILSGEGDDIIFGDQGNDNISGGSGSDIIKGQSGEDILQGGTGLDIINGGDGFDIYKSVDEINNDLILNCEINE